MNNTKKITGLSLLVLAQVILFVLVYLATIGLGAGLIYLIFHASIWVLPPFFENVAPEIMRLGRLGFVLLGFIVIAIIGLYAFVLAVAVYLVKPLFIFPKRNKNYGKKIKREDSPELYDMIMETAKAVGVRKPKNIFVNHEVNACVFFNTGFWNIFLPVRKNLAIGLGLFESTNTEEVKSILAHEFGHFAQNSMRVGSILYITNKVISDLAYRRDALDSLMLRWCLESGVWGFWGKATQSVVIRFRNIVDFMFRSQQRNYMKLSRQMEYDADSVACRIVGTDTFISALCKIQKLDKTFGFYNQVLSNFANQNQTVTNYWKGYKLTLEKMESMNNISFDSVESIPEFESAKSLVSIEEIWESHPSIENRISNAKELNISKDETTVKRPAWDLVSQSLKDEISSGLLQILKDKNTSISAISWSDFSNILAQKIDVSLFPNEVEPFFNRDLIISNDDYSESNPLTDKNKIIIKDYEQAINDMHTLKLLKDGKIPVKHFIYKGLRYSVTDVPLSEHEEYLQILKEETAKIDSAIKNLAKSKSSDISLVQACYDAIEYAQSISKSLREDFIPVRDDIIKELNKAQIADEEDFDSLREWLDSYESAIKDVLKNLKYRQLVPFMSKEEHEHMISFLDAARSFLSGINSNAINHMFAVTDWIMRVHDNLSHASKMIVVNIIIDKNLPDTKFLELWRNSDNEVNTGINESQAKDGKKHIQIDSPYGNLNLTVPTDEELDVVYYQEWFRYRLWEAYEKLERGQKFDYGLVATIPFKEENGRISCANQDDEQKFMAEIEEFYRFLHNHFTEPDWTVIQDKAEQGDARANSQMAELYYSQDRFNMAFEAAMKGALQGDDDGIVMLGILEGIGQERHLDLAVNLFKCAALSGNMHAQCNLGLRYAKGEGIEKDEARAIRFFERSALQGNSFAQNNVGYMYLNGKGVEVDPDRGLYWLYKAANNGYQDAVNTIWQYHKATGDTDQYIKVVRWGAQNGIEECRAELDILSNIESYKDTNVNPFNFSFGNPVPVTDFRLSDGLCPVCGKKVEPNTTRCPHCNEIIWDDSQPI